MLRRLAKWRSRLLITKHDQQVCVGGLDERASKTVCIRFFDRTREGRLKLSPMSAVVPFHLVLKLESLNRYLCAKR